MEGCVTIATTRQEVTHISLFICSTLKVPDSV
jgi:hypothetical protein